MPDPNALRNRLHEVVKIAEARLATVRQELDQRAAHNQELAETLRQEGGWYSRLEQLEEKLRQLKAKAEVRQTLVSVGKRGQGKSTLIRKWLAPGIKTLEGQDPLPLPTGVDETTSALVRLTSLGDHTALEVRLLPAEALPDITHRPDRPGLPEGSNHLLLDRRTADAALSAFSVMRYPVDNADRQVYLERQGERYVMGRQGSIPLPAVQYHAAEIVVPLAREELSGHTRQLLETLDVVDAPGADPSGRGEFPDWMRYKSREVFRRGNERIDLLMLVVSIEVAAVHLGGQMQAEILEPWRKRCQDVTQGRLLIVITHAADLLQDVCEPTARDLEERSPARRIVGNVLEPLAHLGFFDLDGSPDDWPPIFFVENDRQRLEPFQKDWRPDQLREKRLFDLLNDPPAWAQLPLGEQCIVRIASDWQQEYGGRWPTDKIERLQRWFIHALCRLLDPVDQGLSLLTEFVLDWAARGPVARNYLQERIDCFQDFQQRYFQFLAELNEPDYHAVLRELDAGRTWLKQRWPKPEGLDWKLGKRCKDRLEQARLNSGPNRMAQELFSFEDVLQDIVDDAMEQMQAQGQRSTATASAAQNARDYARTALLECLGKDFPMTKIKERYQNSVAQDPEDLARVQAFAFERLTRIIDYLVDAQESQLREVLSHCYRRDLTQNAAIRQIYSSIIQPHIEEDRQAFQEVAALASQLQTEMQSWRHRTAY